MTGRDPEISVLLIDDEPFQLKLLARQFTQLGVARVQSCQDADEALALLRAEPQRYALVCCDLQMPGMDGIEFVRHLGEMSYAGAVALISGEDSRILHTALGLGRARDLRMLDALQKPVAPRHLKALLDEVCKAAAARVRRERHAYTAAALRAGIDAQQMIVHYQPKVELRDGRVTGVEALVRWNHPLDGLVGPDDFIGLAEQAGLVDAITHCVLEGPRGALAQARRWLHAGWPLQVAVNVSMDSLTDHGFPDYLVQAIAQAGLPPALLAVEVTESRVMTDPLITLDVLTRLRLKRIGVAIDDFGTGHSSLKQLRDVPFDELKIDRGFVHGACDQEALRAILLPSLDMARQLGIRSVAEGVEDLNDWCFLRERGCDLAQGYFIARPMPAEAVAGWLQDWEIRRAVLLRRCAEARAVRADA